MKIQTLIYHVDGSVVLRIDNYLYQPKDVIILEGNEYQEWDQYDELDGNGWLIRKIRLKNF